MIVSWQEASHGILDGDPRSAKSLGASEPMPQKFKVGEFVARNAAIEEVPALRDSAFFAS
jgi:hypothetical protein